MLKVKRQAPLPHSNRINNPNYYYTCMHRSWRNHCLLDSGYGRVGWTSELVPWSCQQEGKVRPRAGLDWMLVYMCYVRSGLVLYIKLVYHKNVT